LRRTDDEEVEVFGREGGGRSREQPAVDVWEGFRPRFQLGLGAVGGLGIHRPEQFLNHLMRVAGLVVCHLLDAGREQALADENAGIFREQAEDEPRHELVEVGAARGGRPVLVLLQELDVQFVQMPCRADVDRVVLDLRDGGDTGQRQEEAEVLGEVRIKAADGLARRKFLSFEVDANSSRRPNP
jgi:hypothetical protein